MTDHPMRFTFSDTIAGYVTSFDASDDSFGLRTSDGREVHVWLTPTTWAQIVRNLGEAYLDCTPQMQDKLVPGRYLFTYGIYYPEGGPGQVPRFEAQQIVFPAAVGIEYVFEKPDWWIKQVKELGDFYLQAQFPDGSVDYRSYRVSVNLSGKTFGNRQEVDTISRLTYGFASAYLLTGEDRFLEAAEKATAYLRDHLRVEDEARDIVYWYHGVDIEGDNERKIFASEFGDDYDAIPAYEQIYALAGPTQLYRITGDPKIRSDIDRTLNLFEKYFKDTERGGYFSHIDPVMFDPRSERLGSNRARKNWNSVGDHAPAYLINAYLATSEKSMLDFLVDTADTIATRFPDYDNSPFVQERFHEDWSPDREWGWQQDRGIVGHNLKIAWNLMRIHHAQPDERYVALARKIAEVMPPIASDLQRGGWYDGMARRRKEGQDYHRFIPHDRKAWWQQEQAILAYQILHGSLGDLEHLRLARESAAFYNAFFLDHEDGAVYFNVLANGLPFLLGTERLKGSHSMANYHSSELCYLAATYSNLLITKQPLELHFKPKAVSFPDRILRAAPDLLPPGSVRLSEVWVDEQPHDDFDADALTVRLPDTGSDVKVRVRLVPVLDRFDVRSSQTDKGTQVVLKGHLDDQAIPHAQRELERVLADRPSRVVLVLSELETLSRSGLNLLLVLRQKRDISDSSDFVVVGANDEVRRVFEGADDSGPAERDFVFLPDQSDLA